MTLDAIRDDRTNQEEQNQYERAVQQAAVRRQEVAAAEATASRPPMSSGRTITPADVNESVTNRPVAESSSGSSNTGAGISRAVGPVAEDFPWPYEFAPAPPPPLIRVQGPDFINGPNGNAFIDTIAFVTPSGQLQATTHVQATNLLGGVTTGTLIVVADETGSIVARSGLQQIGVDGIWIPFKESNRIVPWTEEFGPEAAARGRALYVAHFHAGRNRLVEDINAVFGAVADVAEFVTTFCRQNPELCSAVAKAFGV